jgi:stage II sporulation protein AA (anti-sigma F factor antagonist)
MDDLAHHAEPWHVSTDVRLLPGAVVCRVTGPVDAQTAPQMGKDLHRALARAKPPRELRVDLSGVDLFSAAGLNVLLSLRDAAAVRRTPLVLVAPSQIVRRTLQATDADRLFVIRDAGAPVSTAVGQALDHLRRELDAGRWAPTARDCATLTQLLPQLEGADPDHRPSCRVPPAEYAARLCAAAAELASAALTTRGVLADVLSRCAAALVPLGDLPAAADGDGAGAAQLSDAGGALRRLTAFLRTIHQPGRDPGGAG